MYIDEHKFEIDKEVGGPLLLKPLGDFEIAEFIKTKREAILRFSEDEPFFVIRGHSVHEGETIGNTGDYVNTHWHFDEGGIVVLSNEFNANELGFHRGVYNVGKGRPLRRKML